jgi:hypothetical protein
VEGLCNILQSMSRVLAFSTTKFLEPLEILSLKAEIDHFFNLVTEHEPKLLNKTKVHLLLSHVVEFGQLHGFFGLLSEQSTESIHSVFNSTEKYKNCKKNRLYEIMFRKQLVKKVFCFDTGRSDV